MKRKNIKQLIGGNKLTLGVTVTLPSPNVAEMAGLAGYDFIRLDAEHHIYNLETIGNFVRAADSVGVAVIVRLIALGAITSLLDFGVAGIMIPHVKSAHQVKELVDIVKYYPTGNRGMSSLSRAARYGTMSMTDYIAEANDETLLIGQIEDKEGITNLNEIVQVDGLDLVALGRNDLSQALGIPGQINHPDVCRIESKIMEVALKAGRGVIITARNVEQAVDFYKQGARAILVGQDNQLLINAMTKLVSEVRGSMS
jgi:2-keto-3-deoxy-L-rhamnonate aldolase RhmA